MLLRAKPMVPLFDNLTVVSPTTGSLLYPTDIDMVFDFKKALLVVEFKHGTTPLTEGQRILLERMTNRFGILVIPVVAEVHLVNPDGTFDAAQTIVRSVYAGKTFGWIDLSQLMLPLGHVFNTMVAVFSDAETKTPKADEVIRRILGGIE